MRIILIQETDWLKKGPHDQHHLAEKLSLRGHHVRVIDHELFWRTEDRRELYFKRQVFDSVHRLYEGSGITLIRPGIIKIPWVDYFSVLFSHWGEIRQQVKEFSPDVFVGFGVFNSYLAMREARKNHIPFVHYWTDVWHLLIPVRMLQPVGEFVEKITLRQADAAIATNNKLGNRLISMGASPERTHILRKGVDFKRFNPEIDARLVREQYGINQNDIVLLYVGTLSSFSGLRELALEFARVNHGSLKLMLVGQGELYQELELIREKYCLQGRLILTGRQPYDKVPGLIAASDICLLPFHHTKLTSEIAPMKMYDYMAMKKPIISTSLPGVIAEFGYNSGVIYVEKPEDIVERALELVAQGNLAELGVKARKVVEGHSWDSITDEFEKILENVIRKKEESKGKR